MERLQCHVQNYAWGKKGLDSEVARVFKAGHENATIDMQKSYAELWMGTHPDGPARLKRNNMKLSNYITESETSVYEKSTKDTHLPFIMKLMSIDRTLSLQAHPTKEQAARLNDRDPVHYPDRNHKPELAYALTKFELLCGFRPATEIATNIAEFSELGDLMGEDTSTAFRVLVQAGVSEQCATTKAALAVCFKKLIHAREDTQHVKALIESFLLKLDSGECIECVGCSNNTIRAACTPKYIDVEGLCEVLNYRMGDPSYYLVPAVQLEGFEHVHEYAPDCKDFTLHEIKIESASDDSPIPIPRLTCGSIMVIVDGSAELENLSERGKRREKNRCRVKRGDILYIAPGAQPCFYFQSEQQEQRICAYRTFSYEVGPDHSQRNTSAAFEQPALSKVKVQKKGRAKYLVTDEDADIFDVETEMDGVC
ncbi:unnamed protein product [Anisakis simplex]|uniref:mannose-6-phosphate isomerase n=1 Tax=Anisakis simplex TaxID=6269 RepID=A0A0M3K6L6_ANISI|nr:unnamed protein product [Anisakis simplex]